PSLSKPEVNIARRFEDTRISYEDIVTESKINFTWNTPQWGTKEDSYLKLAGMVLSRGKSSRLYKKLIYEDQTATSASAGHYANEIAGQFEVNVRVKPGNDPAKLEADINKILAEFIEKGPTQEEL